MEQQTIDTTKPDLFTNPANFAEAIAKLQAEAGPVVPQKENEAKPTKTMPAQAAQPEAPAAADTAVTPEPAKEQAPAPVPVAVAVPEKFKTPDGNIDVAKLEKSTVNADLALAKYLEKEKELKRKMNEVRQAENAYLNPNLTAPAPAPVQAPAPNAALTFEQQLEADMQAHGAGKVLAKLFTAAQESALEQARRELMPIKEGFEESRTRQQIEAIGKADPWVYTPEGVAALNQVLAEQPYLMAAPDPFKAAYLHYQGLNGVTARANSQVLTPTPTAKASAPVPTATAANQTPKPASLRLDSKEAIESHLKTLTPKQQEEFFMKQGFPAFGNNR